MKAPRAALPGRNRIMALVMFALIFVLPAGWIVWSLFSAAAAEETTRSQSVLLDGLQKRLASLEGGPAAAAPGADSASIYLPGETPAIAGAALQKMIVEMIQGAGGRVVETEFAREEGEEAEAGKVGLRVSFDAETVTLQQILYQLESGMPVLVLDTLNVQSAGAEALPDGASPLLRVTLLVGGFLEEKAAS